MGVWHVVVMMDMEISCKGHCEKFTLSRPCEPYCKVEPIPLLLPDLAKNGSIIVYNTSKILILNFDVISFEQMSPELFFFFFGSHLFGGFIIAMPLAGLLEELRSYEMFQISWRKLKNVELHRHICPQIYIQYADTSFETFKKKQLVNYTILSCRIV